MRLLGGFPGFHNKSPLLVADHLATLTAEDTELAFNDLKRKTDDLPDDGETAGSSHQWTDVESEILEESEVLSDVEHVVTVTTVRVLHGNR